MIKIIKGYTTGVFDLFHIGHLRLLQRAKAKCDYLIVGVNSDELVESYKGKRPVVCLEHRLEIVGSIKYVDEVVVVSNRDKKTQYFEIKYDVIFVGDDWHGHPVWSDLEMHLQAVGAGVIYLPYTKEVSSTQYGSILQELNHES